MMQEMFLSKFKKLKQKNKILFNKAITSHIGNPEQAETPMLALTHDNEIDTQLKNMPSDISTNQFNEMKNHGSHGEKRLETIKVASVAPRAYLHKDDSKETLKLQDKRQRSVPIFVTNDLP